MPVPTKFRNTNLAKCLEIGAYTQINESSLFSCIKLSMRVLCPCLFSIDTDCLEPLSH